MYILVYLYAAQLQVYIGRIKVTDQTPAVRHEPVVREEDKHGQ